MPPLRQHPIQAKATNDTTPNELLQHQSAHESEEGKQWDGKLPLWPLMKQCPRSPCIESNGAKFAKVSREMLLRQGSCNAEEAKMMGASDDEFGNARIPRISGTVTASPGAVVSSTLEAFGNVLDSEAGHREFKAARQVEYEKHAAGSGGNND
jgi:hypothetical protein